MSSYHLWWLQNAKLFSRLIVYAVQRWAALLGRTMRMIVDSVIIQILLLYSPDSLFEKFESNTRYVNCQATEVVILHQTCNLCRHHLKHDIAKTTILIVCALVNIFPNRSELSVAEMLNDFSESRFGQSFQALCKVLLALRIHLSVNQGG